MKRLILSGVIVACSFLFTPVRASVANVSLEMPQIAVTDTVPPTLPDSLQATLPDSVLVVDSALVQDIVDLRAAVNKRILSDTALVNKYTRLMKRLTKRYKEDVANLDDDSDDDNPVFFRLVAPLTLYSSPLKQSLKLDNEEGDESSEKDKLENQLALPWQKDLDMYDELDKLLMIAYLEHPDKVKQTEASILGEKGVNDDALKQSSEAAKLDVATVDEKITAAVVANPEMVVKRPNFWTTKGTIDSKMTESYLSPNWYQGGKSNINILSSLTFDANYNDKKKISFDNRFEAKVGFYKNTGADIQSNTDLLRVTSKLSLKAIKSWNYTAQLQAYSQMMQNFDGNNKLKSRFLAPAYGSLSLGMDWKKKLKKGDISVFIGPLTYNCRYVSVADLRRNFIPNFQEGGGPYYHDFGTKVETNFSWKLTKVITYKTRLFMYTPYKYLQGDWENTFNFQVGKYLSTTLFIHPRLDTSVKYKEEWGKWNTFQMKEYLMFGFNYSW